MKKKTLVVTTGFYNTGSSIVTNILQEIRGVRTMEGVNEWRLLYDPDAIRDLEYHLLENPHRQNTAYAVLRFKKYIDFNSNSLFNHHYEKGCNGNFRKISYEYIDDISEFVYNGVSMLDIQERGKLFCFVERVYSKIIRTLFSSYRPSWVRASLMPRVNPQFAGTYDPEKFYLATRNYISKLFMYVNRDDSDYLMADQFFPASGVNAFFRYIPESYETKVFIVDRDPRDLFFTCKYYLHTKSIPTDDVKIFCKWYKWTREQSRLNDDNDAIMRINFEDAIYEYDTTREKILKFCGLEDNECISQYKHFNPNKSINNTQVWKRYPGHKDEYNYILDTIGDYCYSFENKSRSPDFEKGRMFDC